MHRQRSGRAKASTKQPTERSTLVGSAQTSSIKGQDVVNLTLAKGSSHSYEDQLLADYSLQDVMAEPELQSYLDTLSPQTSAEDFLRRQRLFDRDNSQVKVAAAILFAESPPAVMPKRCSIKIARYGTKERLSGQRASLGDSSNA